jgi:very-short-patch-repair endonuclease
MMWSALRRRGVHGWKFRRQFVIGGYVVDFYCVAARLAVEVDGPVHLARSAYDEARDAHLMSRDVIVLRVRNEDVRDDLGAVLHWLDAACEARAAQRRTPDSEAPSPRLRGEGRDGG